MHSVGCGAGCDALETSLRMKNDFSCLNCDLLW
jgi:hypothetical protein